MKQKQNIDYKIIKSSDINCNVILSNYCTDVRFITLHEYGIMKRWWQTPNNIDVLVLAFADIHPVGASMLMKQPEKMYDNEPYIYNLSVYVQYSFRKQGIGTKLLELISPYAETFYCHDDESFSAEIFRKTLGDKAFLQKVDPKYES